MVNPGIKAEMAILIRRQKELEEERQKITQELPVWEKRIKLAMAKGKEELADEAGRRFLSMEQRADEITAELETIERQKTALRFEARRPSGDEVRRAEQMVESVRQGGLIDPDEAALEREFEQLKRQSAGSKPSSSGGDDDEPTVFDFDGSD